MYDAIVVGARCAGSPTAMLLARKGYRVLLVDKASFPSDTMSTHYIHQPGISRLNRWVETFRKAGTAEIIEGGHLLDRASGYDSPLKIPASNNVILAPSRFAIGPVSAYERGASPSDSTQSRLETRPIIRPGTACCRTVVQMIPPVARHPTEKKLTSIACQTAVATA